MRTIRRVGMVLLLVTVIGCASPPNLAKLNGNAPAGRGFVMHQANGSDGTAAHRYSVFVPHNYTPDQPLPAIVFLHGLGESGTDGRKPLTMGLAKRIQRDPASFDFLAIFPQTRGDWTGDASHELAMVVLDDAMQRYAVDASRIVLTGISTGGQGVWMIGAKHPGRFSRLVPIAGWAADSAVQGLVGIPIWAFHCRFDPIVPSGHTARMVRNIRKKGGNARYTGYSSFSHFAWERAYRDPELLQWMRESAQPTIPATIR